jgi:hypothetical protein
MATTARDEIIADWRKHLADAQDPLSPGSPRTAWLTRLKLRLYRFLLSLYGDGRWNGSDRTVKGSQGAEPVVVSDEVLPFSGKPAKDEHQIRAALRSVAEASDVRTKSGPFVAGKKRRANIQVGVSRGDVKTGAIVCNVSVVVLVATILVLFKVSVLHLAWPAFTASNAGQVFVNKVLLISLACLVTSALTFGVFFNRLRP